MGAIFKNSIPYSGGGGTEYTAGDGIVIENDEISTDNMSSEDMSEVASPMPSVMSRRMKYSTDEQVVGEWIDGKPLYQKTITGLNLKFDWVYQNLTHVQNVTPFVDNVDNVWMINAIMENQAGTIRIYPNINIKKESPSSWSLDSIEDYYLKQCTIQYTKTTD